VQTVIEPLLALQQLEFTEEEHKRENADEIARLRQSISEEILMRYDRLLIRGKKALAAVRCGVCAECHMRLPTGLYAELLRAEELLTCANCGRYLYLFMEAPETVPQIDSLFRIAATPAPKRPRTKAARKAPDADEKGAVFEKRPVLVLS
jgi:hypothetical protein